MINQTVSLSQKNSFEIIEDFYQVNIDLQLFRYQVLLKYYLVILILNKREHTHMRQHHDRDVQLDFSNSSNVSSDSISNR
jgi:hypothetical protein